MNRNTIVRFFTFIGGIYFAARFFIPAFFGGSPPLQEHHEAFLTGLTAIGAAAVGLGIISLLMVHGKKIAYLRSGWGSSSVLLCGLFAMLGAGIAEWYDASKQGAVAKRLFVLRDFASVLDTRAAQGIDTTASRQALLQELATIVPQDSSQLERIAALSLSGLKDYVSSVAQEELKASTVRHEEHLSSKIFAFLYDGIFVALGAAMFSLLGCYIASAAFRAFRIRSLESGLMMIAALLVILGQIPWGQSWWEGFPVIRMWLLNVPSSAAFRAIEVGSAVAGIVLAWRIWLGFDVGKRL